MKKSPNSLTVAPATSGTPGLSVATPNNLSSSKQSTNYVATLVKHGLTLLLLRWLYTKLKPSFDDLLHILAVSWNENLFHPWGKAIQKAATAKGWLQVNNAQATDLRRLKFFKFIQDELKVDMSPLYSKMDSTRIALANLAQAVAMYKHAQSRWKWDGTNWNYVPRASEKSKLTNITKQMAQVSKLAPGWRSSFDYGRQVQFTLFEAAPYFFTSDYDIVFDDRFTKDYQTWSEMKKSFDLRQMFEALASPEALASSVQTIVTGGKV